MTLLDQIEVFLTQKEAIQQKIAELTEPLETKVQDIEGKILELRQQLEAYLLKMKTDKVHSTDGRWYFSRSVRHTRVISDEEIVTNWLKENDLYGRYTRLDKVGIVSLAGKREVPGIIVEEKEIFTLKEVAEKVEEIKATETSREMSERIEKERGENEGN